MSGTRRYSQSLVRSDEKPPRILSVVPITAESARGTTFS
ncbi:hypothetical protein OROMI_033413 [Orobanche minor]